MKRTFLNWATAGVLAGTVLLSACGGAAPEETETTTPEPTEETTETSTETLIPTADEADEPIVDELGNWKALEDFHMEMGMTYHPVVEEGKIEVAKESAMPMAQKAQALAGATPTAAFDNATARKYIDELVVKTQDFANLMSTDPSDEEIVQALEDIHSTYHALEESKVKE